MRVRRAMFLTTPRYPPGFKTTTQGEAATGPHVGGWETNTGRADRKTAYARRNGRQWCWDMNDAELIDRLTRGDNEAFDLLLATYQDRIVNTCYRFVQHAADAEDVAQEVFVEILQSIDQFRRDASLSTWIYRVAVTRSLDFLRKKNRKKRLGHLKQMLGFHAEENEIAFEPEDHSEPTEALERQERAAVLARAVSALPENQRIAITLNQYEGLSYAAVADIMTTSVSAVESLLFRAKKNLRKQLLRYYDEVIE